MLRILAALALICLPAIVMVRAAEEAPPGDESPATLQFELAERLYYTRLYRSAIPQYEEFRDRFARDARMPEALFHLGQSLYQAERYAEAAAVLGELIGGFPDSSLNGPAYLARGECSILAGSVRDGMTDLKKFLTLVPTPEQAAEAKYQLGRGYRLLGDLDSAAATFDEVVTRAPQASLYRPMSLFQLGEIAVEKEQWAGALELNRRVIREFPDSPLAPEAQLRDGTILMKLKQHQEALDAYRRVPEDSPLRQTALLGSSQALYALEQYSDAIAPCRDLIERFPDGSLVPQALYQIGSCQLVLKLYEQAANTLQELATRFPDHEYGEKGAAALVLTHYQGGADRAAALLTAGDAYLKRYPTGPGVGKVRFFMGEARLWQKQYDEALIEYQQVPADSEIGGEASFRIGAAYDLSSRPKEAAAAYDAFIADHPNHRRLAQALFAAGAAFQRLSAPGEAKARYARLMQQFPADPLAARALYETAMCQYPPRYPEDMAVMREDLDSYIEKYPQGEDLGSANYWLGYCAAQFDRDYDKALAYYQQAAELPGRFQKEARLRVAETLYSEGKEEESADRFLELITNLPDLVRKEEVYVYVANSFHKQGELSKAIFAFEKLLERYPNSAWRDKALYELGNLCAELPQPDWSRSQQYFAALLQYYETLQKENPDAPAALLYPAKFGLGRALRALGQVDEARPLLEEAWKHADNRRIQFSAQLALADLALEAKQYEQARDLFLPIGVLYNDPVLSPEALYKAGRCLVMLGALNEAQLLWQELAKRFPDSPWMKQAHEDSQKLPAADKEG